MSASHTIDPKIIAEFLKLSAPNVSDALDRLQIDGAPQGILPLFPCAKIVGPAATLKLVPAGKAELSAVNGTLEAIVSGGAGSVLVIDHGARNVNSYVRCVRPQAASSPSMMTCCLSRVLAGGSTLSRSSRSSNEAPLPAGRNSARRRITSAALTSACTA